MKVLVGLGNPGNRYDRTRHNIGFWALDAAARRLDTDFTRESFQGSLAQADLNGEKILLFKPQTFMNLSGRAVSTLLNFYKVDPADNTSFLVVADDVCLEPGVFRFRLNGASGGHKGVQNIIECLGTDRFARLKIGVGNDPVIPMADFVLKPYSAEEDEAARAWAKQAGEALLVYLKSGPTVAMNRFTTPKPKKKKEEKVEEKMPATVTPPPTPSASQPKTEANP